MAICKGAARPTLQELLSRCCLTVLCVLVILFPARSPAAAAAEQQVEFDPAFLQGGSQVDVSRFSRGNPVLPGDYMVDLQINGKWMGRASVRFVAQPNSDIALPCIETVAG